MKRQERTGINGASSCWDACVLMAAMWMCLESESSGKDVLGSSMTIQ